MGRIYIVGKARGKENKTKRGYSWVLLLLLMKRRIKPGTLGLSKKGEEME